MVHRHRGHVYYLHTDSMQLGGHFDNVHISQSLPKVIQLFSVRYLLELLFGNYKNVCTVTIVSTLSNHS